jgi:hypothetical protein
MPQVSGQSWGHTARIVLPLLWTMADCLNRLCFLDCGAIPPLFSFLEKTKESGGIAPQSKKSFGLLLHYCIITCLRIQKTFFFFREPLFFSKSLFLIDRPGSSSQTARSMIFLYTFLLLVLAAVKFLFQRRAAYLAWRYSRATLGVEKLLHDPLFREGNSNRVNQARAAQRQYLLGQLVQKKERLESKNYFWQNMSDKLARALDKLRNWKGKKLPYTLGALDVWLLFYLLDQFGVADYVSPRNLFQLVSTWLDQG